MHTDEDEHSIEMHLPYIAKVMEGQQFTIVPVMVGSLSSDKEATYGKIFSKYLSEPENLFVISSDFCHWGKNLDWSLGFKLLIGFISLKVLASNTSSMIKTGEKSINPYKSWMKW